MGLAGDGHSNTPEHWFHVGDRCRDCASALWTKIPLVYREQARFHTD
jgi:hypothetical protein